MHMFYLVKTAQSTSPLLNRVGMVHPCLLGKLNLISKNNNPTTYLKLKVEVPYQSPNFCDQLHKNVSKPKRNKEYFYACLLHSRNNWKTLAGSLQYKEHLLPLLPASTANSTPVAKPTCLAQSRKEKVIFPL